MSRKRRGFSKQGESSRQDGPPTRRRAEKKAKQFEAKRPSAQRSERAERAERSAPPQADRPWRSDRNDRPQRPPQRPEGEDRPRPRFTREEFMRKIQERDKPTQQPRDDRGPFARKHGDERKPSEGFKRRFDRKSGDDRRPGGGFRQRDEFKPREDRGPRGPSAPRDDRAPREERRYGEGDRRTGNRDRRGGSAGPGRDRGFRPQMRKRATIEVHGEVQKNPRGFAFLLHKPEDIFIPPQLARGLVTGDSVKAQIDARTKEAVSLEIVTRALKFIIGNYDSNFGTRRVIIEEKMMREEINIVERPNIEGLRTGDKVLVEILKHDPLEGRIKQTFGAKLAPKLDTFAVVVRSNWPQEFSPAATKEAEMLSERIQREAHDAGYPGRKDLRKKPFVTIDGKDARDFDDAVLVEKTSAGFVLYVAIADVAEFLRPGTTLDQEAYGRATSVYFPEWVIPMLPEALSNGACSLRPDEDKLTLTCEMHFDFEGKKKSAKVYESVIRSHRRCIYEDVQVEYDKGEEFWVTPYELFRKIRERRFKRGALDLELPDTKVILDEHGDTIDIKKLDRVDAHKVIEEFMIAANEAVTELVEREGWPFVYRVHEPPKPESLARFESFAMALGLRPNFGQGNDPKTVSRFIDSVKDKPFATTLHYLLLRSLKQARYEPVNLYHFGLASRAYTHFTSPIRRYPDTMVHRILKRFIHRKNFDEHEEEEFMRYLSDSCDHCSKQERKAGELDSKVIRIKKARFMEKHLGEVFDARITNVSENGLMVELETWFVDGLVPADELGQDVFEYIEEKLMLRGRRSGLKYRIGDPLRVQVLRTDIDNGFIDFTLEETNEDLQHG